MADDADVQAPDITPEDFMADEQETVKVAPSTTPEAKADAKAEDKKPEAEPKVETPEVPVKDEAKPDEAKADEAKPEEEAKPEAKADDKPLSKAEERKQELSTEIRDLVAQRNAIKSEVEKINSEAYQPATEDELTAEGMTAIEAKVEAMRQEREMEKYNSQVADAQLTIGHESNRVLNDFPIFNPDSDQYDKELAGEAADLLQSNLIYDPNTKQVIGTNPGFSTYKIYQTLARASGISAAKGQMQGQKDTETMLANADTASSAAPPAKKADPLAELWEAPL